MDCDNLENVGLDLFDAGEEEPGRELSARQRQALFHTRHTSINVVGGNFAEKPVSESFGGHERHECGEANTVA